MRNLDKLGSGRVLIYLTLILSLVFVDCGGKKKKGFLASTFWIAALTGTNPAKTTSNQNTTLDPNGVPLPSQATSGASSQEVADHGPAVINGNLQVNNCTDAGNNPIACSADSGLDLTQVTVSLIGADGTVVATTKPSADGNYSFNVPDLKNGDYRVLITQGNGVNAAYQDVNFSFNPVDSAQNTLTANLQTSRLYITSGPASITGMAVTPGFKDQTGATVVAAGPLPTGTTVQLLDNSGNVVATTTTNASGAYTFNIPNLANGNYTVKALGSAQTSNSQPFSDVSSGFQFTFLGNNPAATTNVNIPGLVSGWNPATSAVANLVNWSITNVAVSGSDLSGFTVKLKDANGNVIATTTTNASGQYSFSSLLSSGVYSIEVTKNGFLTSNSSFSFTPNPSGSATNVTQSGGPNKMVPKPSNVTGQVSGPSGTPPRIEGASINFRPDSTQKPSNLLYLATGTDDRLRNLASLWMREACLAVSACATACSAQSFAPSCVAANQGAGPSWTYTTYANKVYETSGNNVLFTAVAGVWSYYVAAPGYQNSSVMSITLNGQDVNAAPVVLNPTTHRGQIAGQTVVLDTLIAGTKNAYGAPVSGYSTQTGVPGMFSVLLGNSDNSGNPVAHITVTNASGQYAFDGNSKVVALPPLTTLCSISALVSSVAPGNTSLSGQSCNDNADALRVAYAISQYSTTAKLLSDASNNVIGGDTASVCTTGCPVTATGYQFRAGSYNIIVADPLRHMSASSTGVNISTSNPATSGSLVSVVNSILHLPRRQITGTISDAISTGPMSGATVELGVDTDSDPSTITWGPARRDPDTLSGSRLAASDIQVPSVTTDANGQYVINNVDPGTYVLRVSRAGYVTELVQVTVPSTGSATVVNLGIVQDGPRGNIAGRVVLAGGAPFTGTYTLEIIHPTAGTRPTSPVAPSSLTSGTSVFSNVPNYSIFSVNPGTWKIKFASAGYVPVEGVITVQSGATTNFDIVTMIPGSQAPASISGRLLNAQNNTAITTGLTVRIRPGVGVTSGPYALDSSNATIGAVTSAADGSYVIPNVPAGNYTVEVSGTGYATTYQTVISAGANSANQNILVSPVLGATEVRIVLSWNAAPRDVDSHLEFDAGPYNQVVWNQKNRLCSNATVESAKGSSQPLRTDICDLTLDYDVVTGYGPETVTMKNTVWTKPRRGYSLYNWSNEASLSTSGSTVKVYKSTGLVRTYNVGPAQVGRWWQMFCLQADRTIIDVGQTGCSAASFFNNPQN